MNEVLIANWNSRVARGDIVYHLGDFSLGLANPDSILSRLNGQKWLIVGNHDRDIVKKSKYWTEVRHYHEVGWYKNRACLMHYPIYSWNGIGRGTWMLHGHCHGNIPDRGGKTIEVGVDCFDFRPVSWDEIVEIMKNRPIWGPDYHHAQTN